MRSNYLFSIRKLFDIIRINKNNIKKDINVRVHYTDFRDILHYNIRLDPYHHSTHELNNTIDYIWKNKYLQAHDINNIIINLNKLRDKIHFIYNNLDNTEKKSKIKRIRKIKRMKETKMKSEDFEKIINTFFLKLKTKYDNDCVKENIYIIFD